MQRCWTTLIQSSHSELSQLTELTAHRAHRAAVSIERRECTSPNIPHLSKAHSSQSCCVDASSIESCCVDASSIDKLKVNVVLTDRALQVQLYRLYRHAMYS